MQTKTNKKVAIMIHDLTPWGGQDRSTLEIAWHLNKKHPLEIHSYQLEGYDDWPDMTYVPYHTPVKKPILLKYLHYHMTSKLRLQKTKIPVIQSTGTASLVSNIIQVQFIHTSWDKKQKNLPKSEISEKNFLKRQYHKVLSQFNQQLEKKLYTNDRHFIAISECIKQELMNEFNINAQNISVVHHGVDPEHFHPYQDSDASAEMRHKIRHKHNISDDKIVLLHIGAINERKGISHSLKALKILVDQGHKNLHYLAVGSGHQKPYLDWVKENNLQDHVTFVSHTKDVRQYYWAGDLFFFPSLYEPFGLVILEAMSCGLPTLASIQSGASELIENGISGYTIDEPTNANKLATLVDSFLQDTGRQKEFSTKARAIALQNSWAKVAERYSQVYENLLTRIC